MADYAGELLGKHVLLYVESATTADLFEKKCFFAESLSHTSEKTYDEYESRNCTDPDAPAAKRRTLKSISDTFTGTGHVKSDAQLKELDDWHYSDVKRNVEIRLHKPATDGTIGALVATYKGAARLQVNSRDYNPAGPAVVSCAILIDGTIEVVYPI